MIFVGEHTSYTHAWIASAIESGVRGSVQLLLGKFTLLCIPNALPPSLISLNAELGLIDEAKAVVGKWMARWISVVSALHYNHALVKGTGLICTQ